MSVGLSVEVVYQDERYVAVSKPGGLLVHRSKESSDRTALLQQVRDQVGKFVHPVHRIDRAASGLVLFAFGAEETRLLQEALASSATRKEYLALARGSTPEAFESRRPLSEKDAWTEFELLAELSRCSLLQVRLHTGRRHQIRRHLAHLAHHVLGDTRYGKGRDNRFFRETYDLPRLFLHARRLVLTDPFEGVERTLDAPLAEDLRAFLMRLPEASDLPFDSL